MGRRLAPRAEITSRHAEALKAADTRTTGRTLGRNGGRDAMVAGQRPASADQRRGSARRDQVGGRPWRRGHVTHRANRFTCHASKVLRRVWVISGGSG